MQVILLEKLGRLGSVGDVVEVKNGFARNFLIPQKRALRATNENKKYFAEKRAEIEKQNEQKRSEAEKSSAALAGMQLNLVRAASDDGRLYGSVTVRDLTEELANQGHKIERKHILLPATIKKTGVYDFSISLHPEVSVDLKVKVVRNESELAMNAFIDEEESAEESAGESSAAPAEGEAGQSDEPSSADAIVAATENEEEKSAE